MSVPAPTPAAPRRRSLTWILCALMPVLGLAYQVAAKTTAGALTGTRFGLTWFVHLVHQPSLAVLLLIEALSFAAWMTVLSELPLGAAFPMTAVGYVLIIATSWGCSTSRPICCSWPEERRSWRASG